MIAVDAVWVERFPHVGKRVQVDHAQPREASLQRLNLRGCEARARQDLHELLAAHRRPGLLQLHLRWSHKWAEGLVEVGDRDIFLHRGFVSWSWCWYWW